MSRKSITVMLMVLTMAALSLSACGKNKNNNTNEDNQEVQSESTKESVNGGDEQISSDGGFRTSDEKETFKENTDNKDITDKNSSKGQDNNIDTELQPVIIIPESTGSSSEGSNKNVSKPDSGNSGNDKTQGSKTDPIELPFVPAH